jgi:4-hydroxybenzoyl-CoA thioesterase
MSTIKPIIYKVKVEWGDCDPYGIVFYPNFYKWMDNAQWHYFKKIKQPISKLEKLYKIKGLPLLHTEAKFLSACIREDLLSIETSLVKITNSTLTLQHIIKRKNKIVCSGKEVRIWAQEKNGKIISEAIPIEIRKIFKQYLKKEK